MKTSIPGFAPIDDGAAEVTTPQLMKATAVPVQKPEIIAAVAPKAMIDNPDPLAVPKTDQEISDEADATIHALEDDLAAALLAKAKHGG